MKTTILKSVMLLLVALFSLNVNAYDVEINGVYYNLNTEEKTAEVTYTNSKYTGEVTIPESITHEDVTYPVTSIGGSAFQRCSGLTSVTIPESVTSIAERAFYGCSGLTSVAIPESVTSIGFSAFQDCSGLTSVTIPESVTSIGRAAFAGTVWLMNQEDGLIYINNIALTYKGTMPENTSIVIKEGTISIGSYAFSHCSGLTSLSIPSSVTEIGGGAFEYCSGLTSVTIPESVSSIGSYAFSHCSGLTSLSIPNGVTEIGSGAFEYCSGLTSLSIPNSVTEIGNATFQRCSGVTSVTIPSSVTKIGDGAFWGCWNLTSLSIPNSVTEIGNNAFYECGLTSLTIPNSMTKIGSGAFSGCSGLTSLTILNSAIEVDNTTFSKCDGLTSATVEITDVATWCTKPSTFEVPASCTRYLTLNGNIIKDLVIPQSVTSIGDGAFSNCNDLSSVKVEWNRPLAGGAASIPEDVKKNAPLYVPKGTAMMYMSAPGWSEFVNIVEYEDGEDAHYITIRMGDGGVLKQSVEVGQTYTYAVNADEGWEINTLTFDGKDMTSLLMDGQFSTPVITGNSELNVVFKQKDSSVKAMPSMSEVKVYASNKNITINGAEDNVQVFVYGGNGTLVASAIGNTTFSLESGVYIVKVGKETFKVRL